MFFPIVLYPLSLRHAPSAPAHYSIRISAAPVNKKNGKKKKNKKTQGAGIRPFQWRWRKRLGAAVHHHHQSEYTILISTMWDRNILF